MLGRHFSAVLRTAWHGESLSKDNQGQPLPTTAVRAVRVLVTTPSSGPKEFLRAAQGEKAAQLQPTCNRSSKRKFENLQKVDKFRLRIPVFWQSYTSVLRTMDACASSTIMEHSPGPMNLNVNALKTRPKELPPWTKYVARRDACSCPHGLLPLLGRSSMKDAVSTEVLGSIAAEEVKKTRTHTFVQVQFGLQSTIPKERRSIEAPIMSRIWFQDIDTKSIVNKYCKPCMLPRQNSTRNASIAHGIARSQFFFGLDPDLAKQVQLERPQRGYDTSSAAFWLTVPWKKTDKKCIEESHAQLNAGATGKTEIRIANETKLLRQILPRSLQHIR